MDIDQAALFVNFGVSLGTLFLAFLALKNIEITQIQLKSFQEQTKVFISQNQPILWFDSFTFTKNQLSIPMKNLGSQPAFDIGLSTICLAVKKVGEKEKIEELYKFEWPHITKEMVKDFFDYIDNQKVIIEDYSNDILPRIVQLEFRPERGITYLKRDNGEAFLSPQDGLIIFKTEPFFVFDNDFKNRKQRFLDEKDPAFLRHLNIRKQTFDEILEIYRKNNIRYIYLNFSLFCKDSLENEIFQNEIISCVVDLEVDKTIEDAINQPRALARYHLSHQKIVKDIGYEMQWMYENSKYKTQYLTEIEKEEVKKQNALYKRGLTYIRK